MYAFSPLNLFKSKSKAFAKKNGIKLSDTREQLAQSAGFSNYHSIQTIDANPNIADRLFNCMSMAITFDPLSAIKIDPPTIRFYSLFALIDSFHLLA